METSDHNRRRLFADAGVQVDLGSHGDPGPPGPSPQTYPSECGAPIGATISPTQSPGGRGSSSVVGRWVLPLSVAVMMVAVGVRSTGFWEGFAFQLARHYLEGLGKGGGGGGTPPPPGESGPDGGRGGFQSFYFPLEDLGVDGKVLFKKHDLDSDGFLSVEEFAPLSRRLISFNDSNTYERNLTAEEEIFTVEVKFQPLKIETMSKDFSVKSSGADPLHGLKQWTAPKKTWQNFGVRDFKPFLPQRMESEESVPLGKVYWIVEGSEQRGPSLSSDRYMPPLLESEGEVMVHRLLSLFHPLPFVHMRFAPKGSTAVIRAFNDEFIDISFRIHAEFQLNLPPYFPFWFTPAQFKGHVTIARDSGHLVDFHFYVPTDKRLNIDMEWLNENSDNGNMEVDIGFMSQMELSSTGESIPAVKYGEDRRESFIPHRSTTWKEIVWTEEISVAKAERLLEEEMYPFKKVTYYNFTDGLVEAGRLDRPIHAIALWGCLDDQSC